MATRAGFQDESLLSSEKQLEEERKVMELLRYEGRSIASQKGPNDILAGPRNLDVSKVSLDQFKQRVNNTPLDRFMAEQRHNVPGRFYSS